MSREKKVHNYIERDSTPQQEENWKQIQARIQSSEMPVTFANDTEVNSNRGGVVTLSRRKKIVISFASCVLIGLAILMTCLLVLGNQPKVRYRTAKDYITEETNITLKDYSATKKNEILYLDWYSETELCEDRLYRLKNTDEIICFRESILDMNTGYIVNIGVTDNLTEIDLFNTHKTVCVNEVLIDDINVYLGNDGFNDYAKFETKGYQYYLEVSDTTDSDIIIGYIEQLLA
ncbi:MAG: hypothetical protein HFE27_05985 [Clostridia bacterium]|jgi:hypothetical protein|nr:hypothetical protein [Clostridia bacterium]